MTYLYGAIALLCFVLVVRRGMVSRVTDPPESPPEPAPRELAEITAGLHAHRRTAYLPIVEPGDGPAAASKLSGSPYLAPGEVWPECGNCGRPMQLFVQLAGNELPAEARARIMSGEIFQLLYCTSGEPLCEVECDAWAPHARSTLLRLVVPADGAELRPVPEGMFPAARITGWTAGDDYPNAEELEEFGVTLSDAEHDTLGDSFPRFGEKLLGWPAWVQNAEYPDCRVCGRPMELLFQIDSEHNLPYMFGDSGVGHVTQCAEHRAELAFGWACY